MDYLLFYYKIIIKKLIKCYIKKTPRFQTRGSVTDFFFTFTKPLRNAPTGKKWLH